MNQTKIVAKGALIAFLGIFVSKVLGYLYRLIIARTGTEPYGLINIALGIISLVVIFPLMGLDSGVLRYIAYYKGKKDNSKIREILTSSLTWTVGLSFIFSILIFIFSDKIAVIFFHNIKLGLVLKFFSITIPFYVINRVSLAALRAIKKNQYEVYSKAFFHNVSKIILTILLVYFLGFGLFGLSLAFLLSIIGMGLLSFYFMYKNILKNKGKVSFFIEKEVLFYSLHLMFYSFFYLILAWTDTLMIGSFLDASKAGIYNVALPTASLLVVFPIALRSLFLPTITGLYAQEKKDKIKQVYNSIARWTFLTNLPILLLLIIFSKKILGILFGSEYTLGFACLIILSIGYFLFSFLEISSSLLNMLKKSKLILFNSIFVAILNVILNFFLIPKYGIIGGASATAVSLVVLGLLSCSEGWIYTRLQPFQNYYFRLLIMAGITFLIVIGLNKIIEITNFIDLGFFSFYFVGLYAALLLLSRSIKAEDIDLIRSILVKIKKYYKRDY